MEQSIQRIQAAIIDGRARTPRHLQKQLTLLHDALVKATPAIHQAIVRDTSCSASEAWLEIHLTLKAVKQHFNSIKFHDFLQQEYSLAHGKDNSSRRIAYGCAYIVPAQQTRFYSTIQPVAAAIAAGNCVVVETQQTLSEVGSIIRKTLEPVLDRDTFAVVDQRPSSDKFFTEQVVVANASNEKSPNFSASKVFTSSSRRTIAVVDRSANIAEAARHIVRARFRFGGKSIYAPDLVLVNEFALKEFCQAAIRCLTEELSDSVTANGVANGTACKPQSANIGSGLQKELQQAGTTNLVSGARGSIHLLKQRQDSLLSRKINESVLLINAITSLDDAVDTANTNTSLLATYLFADPKATKYLSQFIISDVSFTNHIPTQLLVGPAAPQGFPISLDTRYTSDMFSVPSPEYIIPTSEDTLLSELLDTPASSKPTIAKLKSEIQTPLPSMGEPMTTTIGFFEQGIFTGLGIAGTLILGTVGVAARYTIPVVWRKLRG